MSDEVTDPKELSIQFGSSFLVGILSWAALHFAMIWKDFSFAKFLDQIGQARAGDLIDGLRWVNWELPSIAWGIVLALLTYIWVKHKFEFWWLKALLIFPLGYAGFLINTLLA
jgi:hypothetical protein